MLAIPKSDLQKILKVFTRRIGLLFLFVIALYFDGTHFASIFPHAQLVTNAFMVLAFFILYYRSVKRTRELMIYAVIIGFAGEYFFSVYLGMYTYRLENVPWYIAFGHAAVYARTYMFSKASITRKYAKQINTFLYVIISILALIYLIAFNDVFGFVMTLGVFIMLIRRPKRSTLFLNHVHCCGSIRNRRNSLFNLVLAKYSIWSFLIFFQVTTLQVESVCSTFCWM